MKKILTIALLFAQWTTFNGSTAFAQDRLASIAPIDRKMRAIDSISLVRLNEQEAIYELQAPAAALYPTWNNDYTRDYGVALPAEYRIDLRKFHMPCDSRMVTSHYGYRRSFRRQHYGTDIKVFVGDTIRAAFSGKVRVVEDQGRRRGYGKYIVIRHPNGLETLYGHLSKHLVKADQIVKAGDVIGLGGNTGRSTGSHLHFETRFLGQFINPEKLFDFEAQDVKGDYYLYCSNGRGTMLASNDIDGGEEEMDEETAQALMAKEAESEAYQQKRMQEMKARRSSVHKVKSGDTLSSIAHKYGTTVDRLCRLNNIKKNSVLRLGQILRYS